MTIDGGLILVRKNKPDFMKGRITFIGGKVDDGESHRQAASREFNEELGGLYPAEMGYSGIIYGEWGTVHVYKYMSFINEETIPLVNDAGEDILVIYKNDFYKREDILTDTKIALSLALLVTPKFKIKNEILERDNLQISFES